MDNNFYLGALSVVVFAGVPYVLYRYCYLPWTIMRKDLQTMQALILQLREEGTATRAEMKLRKALYQGDEEQAKVEARNNFRSMMRGLGDE